MKSRVWILSLLVMAMATLWLVGCEQEQAGVMEPVNEQAEEQTNNIEEDYLNISAEEVNAAGRGAYEQAVTDKSPNACIYLYVPYFSQLDSRWKNRSLGHNYCGTSTIGNQGCYLTCLAMLYKKWGYWSMTPLVLNNWSYQGQAHYAFADYGCGDLIRLPQALQYDNMSRPYSFFYDHSRIYTELAAGRPVVAQIRFSGVPSHFVVIYAFDGYQFLVRDPLGRSSRPLYGTILSLRVFGF